MVESISKILSDMRQTIQSIKPEQLNPAATKIKALALEFKEAAKTEAVSQANAREVEEHINQLKKLFPKPDNAQRMAVAALLADLESIKAHIEQIRQTPRKEEKKVERTTATKRSPDNQ